MKGFMAIILGAAIIWGIIHYANKAAPKSELPPRVAQAESATQTVSTGGLPLFPYDEEETTATEDVVVTQEVVLENEAEQARPLVLSGVDKAEPRKMGYDSAPLKMIVFSSLACGHCTFYHNIVLKKIEKDYIEKGLIQMVYVDIPTTNRAFAGSMIARCVPSENYFEFLNLLFQKQDEWAYDKKYAQEKLTGYAMAAGLTKGQITACWGDSALNEKISADREFYMKKYNITGTPTTVLLDEKGRTTTVVGANEEKLRAAIDEMLKDQQ